MTPGTFVLIKYMELWKDVPGPLSTGPPLGKKGEENVNESH